MFQIMAFCHILTPDLNFPHHLLEILRFVIPQLLSGNLPPFRFLWKYNYTDRNMICDEFSLKSYNFDTFLYEIRSISVFRQIDSFVKRLID